MEFTFVHNHLGADGALSIPALGLTLSVRLTSNRGETLEIIETINAPGLGPPLHRHPQTEIFRVLEGLYLYEIAGERFFAEEGDVVCIPGGQPHGFLNIGKTPARQLIVISPSMDSREFFAALGDLLRNGPVPLTELNAFGGPWDVEFLGGPLTNRE